MEHFVTTVALIGIVIVVASLLSGALERTGAPLVAVFLSLGVILGPYGLGLVDIGLTSPSLRVLATLGLALVLFSDAVTIDTARVREHARLTWRLLGPGTLLPAVIIAVAARLLLDVPAPAAAILGAALASTDPVLLRSVLRSPALPPTPRLALRLETGMNDVMLLPIVAISILMLQSGGSAFGGRELGKHLLGLFVLGPALGALVGWLGIIVLGYVRDRMGVRRDYESLYALGLAFTGFAAAEAVGGSGFLAAFFAGYLVARQDIELCDCFLEYGEATAEMLLLLTFVALGTSLIWTGLGVIDGRTLLFAGIALTARTVVLFPILARLGLSRRDHQLIAWFGPRGLSSLLFTLLPVFAGVAGADRLFTVACLVVLMSVVLHGGGMGVFLRRARAAQTGKGETTIATTPSADAPFGIAPSGGASSGAETGELPERIEIEPALKLLASGQGVLVDARAQRSYESDARRAAASVRVAPDDPVRSATEQRLAKHASLLVYCA